MSAETLSPPRAVHLLELPVPLAARAQQHTDELLREFALIRAGHEHTQKDTHTPRRLLELVDTLTARFAGVSDEPRERLDAAIDRGDDVLADHVLLLPPEAGEAAAALGAMLDEADDYCSQGQALLTLAAPEDVLTYRRWYLSEVVGQLTGAPAVPWPEHQAAHAGRVA